VRRVEFRVKVLLGRAKQGKHTTPAALKLQQDLWKEVRSNLRAQMVKIVEEKLLPVELVDRLKLMRVVSAKEVDMKKKGTPYYKVTLERVKEHLRDMYFEPENRPLTDLIQHVLHAKSDEGAEKDRAKVEERLEGCLGPHCVRCGFPGHTLKECPLPVDRVLKSFAVEAKAEGAAAEKKVNSRERHVCSVCDKTTHARMFCPHLPEAAVQEYAAVFDKASLLLEKLKEVKKLSYRAAYRDDHLDSVLEGTVTFELKQAVMRIMKEIGLGSLIPELSQKVGGAGAGAGAAGAVAGVAPGTVPPLDDPMAALAAAQGANMAALAAAAGALGVGAVNAPALGLGLGAVNAANGVPNGVAKRAREGVETPPTDAKKRKGGEAEGSKH